MPRNNNQPRKPSFKQCRHDGETDSLGLQRLPGEAAPGAEGFVVTARRQVAAGGVESDASNAR
jgi:hypothetical protein